MIIASYIFKTTVLLFTSNPSYFQGSLELFSGLGLMVGPPLGGALYTLGGFRVPFISMGTLLVLVAAGSIFILPSPDSKHLSIMCIHISTIYFLYFPNVYHFNRLKQK